MTNVVRLRTREFEVLLTVDELVTVQASAAKAGLSLEDYMRRQVLAPLPLGRSPGDGPAEED